MIYNRTNKQTEMLEDVRKKQTNISKLKSKLQTTGRYKPSHLQPKNQLQDFCVKFSNRGQFHQYFMSGFLRLYFCAKKYRNASTKNLRAKLLYKKACCKTFVRKSCTQNVGKIDSRVQSVRYSQIFTLGLSQKGEVIIFGSLLNIFEIFWGI